MQVRPFCLQHSKTFDILHAFLRVTIAELSTLKQVRFFGPPCILFIYLIKIYSVLPIPIFDSLYYFFFNF